MAQALASVSARTSTAWTVVLTVAVMAIGPLMVHGPELSGFLVFLPAAAAGVCTLRQTIWVALWTLFVTGCVLLVEPAASAKATAALLIAAVGCGLFAVYLCRWRLTHVDAALRLQSAAHAMQRHLLRSLPRRARSVTMAGVHAPLGTDTLIGGDAYDLAETAHGTRVLIADVQGKGLGALGTSVAVVAAFREAAHIEPDVLGVTEAMERAVELQNRYAVETGESERFVTAVVLDIADDGRVSAVNCGHPLPYLMADGQARPLPIGDADVPLGLGSLTGSRAAASFEFPHGSTILLYSDGLNEGRSRDGTFFPLDERVAALAQTSAPDVGHQLWQQLLHFTHHRLQDDTTILTLVRTPPRPA
ncbi:PP2C family protein-serine/threonine phosphatase [Streptomyces sp. NPDC001443]